MSAYNPVANAQVCNHSIKQRILDVREDILNLIVENDWKDNLYIIVLAIFFLCIGVIGTYVSTIKYNEDNDLYPILTKLYKNIFKIPVMFLTFIAVLILIFFDPLPDPD